MPNPAETIKVVVRFRSKPQTQTDFNYFISKNTISLHPDDSTTPQLFTFDNIYEDISQKDLFTNIAQEAVEWVLDGYNSTIFAYGPTGTGKSYTMFGTDEEPGLIPRAYKLLFYLLQHKDLEGFVVKCTFLEIYRENIRDLLNTDDTPEITRNRSASDVSSPRNLRIRQNETGPYVQGLTERYVTSANEITEVIEDGIKNRIVAATALNTVSSRSHAVLTITVSQNLTDGSVSYSKLHLVDLAGSENVSKSEVQGISLAEAQMINKSLSSLGNVIYALTEKGREHIPYRDSRLTYLLQDSLGGNSKAIIITTASTSLATYNETLTTFKFATRAKQIKNQPKINKQKSVDTLQTQVDNWIAKYEELKKQYEEDCSILKQVAAKPVENQQLTLLQMKYQRLENSIQLYEKTLEKEQNRYTDMNQLIIKHKKLAQSIADNLYEAKLQNANLMAKLREYRQFYQNVTDCAENKPALLELVIKNKNFLLINE